MDSVQIVNKLTEKGVKFTTGLTHKEIDEIEVLYNIQFPPDLKEFLTFALPISDGFVNWIDKSKENIESITDRLNWPLEGIVFDIEHNEFWMKDWGKKPSSLKDAVNIATMYYNKAPKLIPLYSHRYIPSTPFEKGNPIMSVHQSDIIYYGENLFSYFLVEFNFKDYDHIDFENIKRISFWGDIINLWDDGEE
ncbi:SMI1/KNR4 family protein [Neobacillus ginsengisoli]|uniref:SMI1/KNR4 family protein n=1 Tax=Neobacillus ginsengisoli TaxID=904295 RepID=A0ABT9Y2A0_9BACI|nr:SMI1/KNR4 family protein [Neobacillus ginsengisoli]MDQ0201952.1 hypothetical protein [Neobacillus ginsengisoli]